MLTLFTEASRAKHKFAVKRNSWPKTRGVAMNPVDHVRMYLVMSLSILLKRYFSLTVVVIINISEKHLRYQGTQHRVKRLVLLQPGELVYYVVHRRQRIRCGRNTWFYAILAPGLCRMIIGLTASYFLTSRFIR